MMRSPRPVWTVSTSFSVPCCTAHFRGTQCDTSHIPVSGPGCGIAGKGALRAGLRGMTRGMPERWAVTRI